MSRDVLASVPVLKRLAYRVLFWGAPDHSVATRPSAQLLSSRYVVLGRPPRLLTLRHNLRAIRLISNHPCCQLSPGRNYILFGCHVIETLRLHRLPPPLVETFTVVDPSGALHKRPLRGPVVLTTVHANWEMCLGLGHHAGVIDQVAAITLSHHDTTVDELFHRVRVVRLAAAAATLESAPLASLRAIQDGEVVAIVGDRDYGQSGIRTGPSNARWQIPVGPAALAVQGNCGVLLVLLARIGLTRFCLFVAPLHHPLPHLSSNEQVQELTHRLARWYRRFLQAVPQQWVAFHPVFTSGNRTGSP